MREARTRARLRHQELTLHMDWAQWVLHHNELQQQRPARPFSRLGLGGAHS